MHQASSRAPERATNPLTEFHTLTGHPGPAEGCQDCAAQLTRQRQAASALRTQRRQARQRIDEAIVEDLAHVDRCACGVLILRGWPKRHVCEATS